MRLDVSSGGLPLLAEEGLRVLELSSVEPVPEGVVNIDRPEPLLRHLHAPPDQCLVTLGRHEPLRRGPASPKGGERVLDCPGPPHALRMPLREVVERHDPRQSCFRTAKAFGYYGP